MSEIIVIVVISIVVQVLCIFINIGTLLAYFQRNRMDVCDDLFSLHLISAILYGMLGMLVISGIYVSTEHYSFGIKFWRGERAIGTCYWKNLYEEAVEKHISKEREKSKKMKIPEGRCVDLWSQNK